MSTILTVLPWLAILACPLMMLFMMRAMPGGSCHSKAQPARGTDDETEEIRRLQARVAELEARNRPTEIAR